MFKILILLVLFSVVLGLHLQVQPRSYYINLDVDNYIQGVNQTGQIFYFSQLVNPANAVKCPFYAPFTVDGLKCFQCGLKLPIFNLGTQRCETCPTGVQGLQNHRCV